MDDWTLIGQGMAAIVQPTPDVLVTALDGLHPRDRCWLALQNRSTGVWMAVAGARMRLTVEAGVAADGWESRSPDRVHWVLGRLPRCDRQMSVPCRIGPLYRTASQVLTLPEAVSLFVACMANADLPAGLEALPFGVRLDCISKRLHPGVL